MWELWHFVERTVLTLHTRVREDQAANQTARPPISDCWIDLHSAYILIEVRRQQEANSPIPHDWSNRLVNVSHCLTLHWYCKINHRWKCLRDRGRSNQETGLYNNSANHKPDDEFIPSNLSSSLNGLRIYHESFSWSKMKNATMFGNIPCWTHRVQTNKYKWLKDLHITQNSLRIYIQNHHKL